MSQGDSFGKYLLHERISVGGMAEVFKATLQSPVGFERTLAIKRILPHLVDDERFISMLIDEAKMAVQLSHPNIAQVHDLGRVDRHYYIAMDFVDGEDMAEVERCQRRRGTPIPIAITAHITMSICAALQHAHEATWPGGQPLGLIHRDVSPTNVLVSFDGEVKVIDFGLAKAVGRRSQTRHGVVKGKLTYLSPEQARGDELDHRSDIYALGTCLWEWLTGKRLYLRDSDQEIIQAVRQGKVPSPRTIDTRVPEQLERIVMRALERERDRRYATALAMHDDLEAFVYAADARISRNDLAQYMARLFPDRVVPPAVADPSAADATSPNIGSPPPGLDRTTTQVVIPEAAAMSDRADLERTSVDITVPVSDEADEET